MRTMLRFVPLSSGTAQEKRPVVDVAGELWERQLDP